MKKLSDFVIYSNLLISAGAACFIWETYLIFGLPVSFLYVIIGFAATLFTYNLDRLVVLNSMDAKDSDRHAWIIKNSRAMAGFSIAAVVVVMLGAMQLTMKSIFFLGHVGLISLAYSIPFLARGKRNLRSIKALKIFLITYVWTASTIIWPLIGSGTDIWQRDTWLLFIERALFIFAITLPFDIRDYESDIRQQVVTIPGIIGVRSTKMLAYACLLLFFVINLIHYDVHSGILLAKMLSGITTSLMIYFVHEKRGEYYFTGLIDSAIIIQFILVLCLKDIVF